MATILNMASKFTGISTYGQKNYDFDYAPVQNSYALRDQCPASKTYGKEVSIWLFTAICKSVFTRLQSHTLCSSSYGRLKALTRKTAISARVIELSGQ